MERHRAAEIAKVEAEMMARLRRVGELPSAGQEPRPFHEALAATAPPRPLAARRAPTVAKTAAVQPKSSGFAERLAAARDAREAKQAAAKAASQAALREKTAKLEEANQAKKEAREAASRQAAAVRAAAKQAAKAATAKAAREAEEVAAREAARRLAAEQALDRSIASGTSGDFFTNPLRRLSRDERKGFRTPFAFVDARSGRAGEGW